MPQTTMNLTQACQQLGITPKTMKDWIDDGVFPGAKKDDRKGRGVWIIPVVDIEIMYRKLHGTNMRTIDSTATEDTLSKITQELERLNARVQRLEEEIDSTRTVNPTKSDDSIDTNEEQPNMLPDGYVSFVTFYTIHNIPETSAGRWRKNQPDRVTSGHWKDEHGHPVKYALSPKQQAQFYQDLNKHQTLRLRFRVCRDCPH